MGHKCAPPLEIAFWSSSYPQNDKRRFGQFGRELHAADTVPALRPPDRSPAEEQSRSRNAGRGVRL